MLWSIYLCCGEFSRHFLALLQFFYACAIKCHKTSPTTTMPQEYNGYKYEAVT
jgi:hypothetical protein